MTSVRKPYAFICDIDGTVAKKGDRGIHDYDKVSLDLPNKPIIDVVQRLAYGKTLLGSDLLPVFMSGRPDTKQCREDTEVWVHDNVIGQHNPLTLFMRPEILEKDYVSADGLHVITAGKRDFRPDYVVKEELYRKHIEPYYDVQFAIDDRPQVLRLWNELGISTLAVGTPWIEF